MSNFAKFLIFIIKKYKFISEFAPHRCRFVPSCSSYAIEAISKYGAVCGLLLFIKRFLKCNYFFKGGLDKVP